MELNNQVSAREEMNFSKEELEFIQGKHFSIKEETVQTPTEGKWFKVNPKAINRKLFKEKRINKNQEATRKLILEALRLAKFKPKKYGRSFETFIPEKNWISKSVEELQKMAKDFGDHNANWVEQALEWAQRISNGETWETICNCADTAKYYRLVIWKTDYPRLIGGSCVDAHCDPPCYVIEWDYFDYCILNATVPLVVRYQ